MSSRGAVAKNGHVTTNEYKMKPDHEMVYDAKVLIGQSNEHGLPDYSHTSNSRYIKENPDGTFRKMRIYGNKGEPLIEIGYHPEPQCNDGNREEKVLHWHKLTVIFQTIITRELMEKLSKSDSVYIENKKYLEVYGL